MNGKGLPTCAPIFGFMYAHPGQEAAVHGVRICPGARSGTTINRSIGTFCIRSEPQAASKSLLRDLNMTYKSHACPLSSCDCEAIGFKWLVGGDIENSVFAFARFGDDGSVAVAVCNFTPMPRTNYRDRRAEVRAILQGGGEHRCCEFTPARTLAISVAFDSDPVERSRRRLSRSTLTLPAPGDADLYGQLSNASVTPHDAADARRECVFRRHVRFRRGDTRWVSSWDLSHSCKAGGSVLLVGAQHASGRSDALAASSRSTSHSLRRF